MAGHRPTPPAVTINSREVLELKGDPQKLYYMVRRAMPDGAFNPGEFEREGLTWPSEWGENPWSGVSVSARRLGQFKSWFSLHQRLADLALERDAERPWHYDFEGNSRSEHVIREAVWKVRVQPAKKGVPGFVAGTGEGEDFPST